ncbi:uncharacterized protein [Lepeophtheirus salmonis]|uniref:uncharacterized protein n=1 Tax=Lepeophtheirus salmonis TaxID=72036 RepID=UPI001AE51158|nr:zinc finger BED domain-containing protein 4-like [Lepeophtheirus salmonis]XP_040565463.1 zinc finger BED domain-containing protein 4-like [Lepeophtheirus salmonis]
MIKLRDTDSLCLTIDIWSNRQIQSFLGLTAHYISSQWTLESVMLRCKRVIGPHISENITLWYEETVSDFDIGHKVKYIITDSALNMKKAFREIRLADFDDEDNGLFNYDCDTEEEYYMEEFDINVEMGNNIADIPFPQHVCFAHTLQLVVKDGLSKNGLDVSGIALKKCFELVASIKKSTIIGPDLLKDEKQRPQSDNITKWLKMIRSVLSISDDKLSSLQGVSKLTSYERLALNDLLDILSPFEEATDAVQLSKGPSAGYILPCIKGLTHHINNKISKYNSSVISNLKQSLVKRMSYYEESEAYLLAALLDPRFKTKWCSSDDEKNKFNNLLKKAVSNVDDSQSFSSTPPQSFSIKQPPVKKKKTLFSFMIDEKEEDYVPGRNHMANKEVKDYLESVTLEMNENPAEFWRSNSKKYPLLSKLAKEFLGIPSSSAPVERLFSVAGNIFRVERCQLTDARFEQLIFIRCNNR